MASRGKPHDGAMSCRVRTRQESPRLAGFKRRRHYELFRYLLDRCVPTSSTRHVVTRGTIPQGFHRMWGDGLGSQAPVVRGAYRPFHTPNKTVHPRPWAGCQTSFIRAMRPRIGGAFIHHDVHAGGVPRTIPTSRQAKSLGFQGLEECRWPVGSDHPLDAAR